MKKWMLTVLATVMAFFACSQAHAVGTFIAAANRTDMVYDSARGIIYIADGDQVLRYGTDCQCMLPAVQIAGSNLMGIDLSPDGKTLAVGDNRNDGTDVWVDLIDADTLSVTEAKTPAAFYETGTTSVAFLGDGSLMTTSQFGGSGWVPMRRLDLSTMTWSTIIQQVRHGTVMSVSGDGKVLAFAEADESDGPWGAYFPDTGTVDRRTGYTDGTSAFNYAVGTNANGTQFALPTYMGTYIYDSSYQRVATLGTYAGPQPIGVAYDPSEPLAYFPWAGSSEVRVYDMNTFQEVNSYDFQDTFSYTNSGSFAQGHARISRDGLLLMVNVTGGVRFLSLLSVSPVTASSSNGGRVQVTLPATNTPTGSDYGLGSQPAHGQAFIQGNVLTYVPDPGFTGTDTFSYAARYHHVTATAAVTIDVTADNSAYDPVVSFGTLPALHPTTPVPGGANVPGDFNGDGTSDLLWFNPSSSQTGYWTMTANTSTGKVSRTGLHAFNVTPGYFIGAEGDFNGDGYADLVFTSASHDLWLWSNNRAGGFSSQPLHAYPAGWQLVGAGDVNGDGKDDLLWLNPSTCQFGYWLMNGTRVVGVHTSAVACGYYPVSVGYYTSSHRLSILWSSAAGDLYAWDAQPNGNFRSYDLSSVYGLVGESTANPRGRWAIGGGVAGQDIGLQWYDPATRTGFGATLTRNFDGFGRQTGLTGSLTWSGNQSLLNPASYGYLVHGMGHDATALYVDDDSTLTMGTMGGINGGNAPQPDGTKPWHYPAGWYVVGAPANGAYPLPWR